MVRHSTSLSDGIRLQTDSLLYKLFQIFPNSFFQIIGRSVLQRTDYTFTSVNIQDLNLQLHGIFLPQCFTPASLSPESSAIYFAEALFHADSDIYWRGLTDVFLYLGKFKPQRPWFVFFLFAHPHLDPGIPPEYQLLHSSHNLEVIYLDQLGPSPILGIQLIRLLLESPEEALQTAPELIRRVRQELPAAIRLQVVSWVQDVIICKFPMLPCQELETMVDMNELKRTRYYQDLQAQAKQEGISEGKLQGKLEIVPRLIALGLSLDKISQVLDIDLKTLSATISLKH